MPAARRVSPLLLGLVAAIGFVAGRTWEPADARADVRHAPERPAFQAGGERSELVLKEIAATLKSIDGRLERIQTHLPQTR